MPPKPKIPADIGRNIHGFRDSLGAKNFLTRRLFGSLERTIHDIHSFSACFKSVRNFIQKCFNFKRSSRSAHRTVKKRTFERHIIAKFASFSLISRFPQDSSLRSKIKKMCHNLTVKIHLLKFLHLKWFLELQMTDKTWFFIFLNAFHQPYKW